MATIARSSARGEARAAPVAGALSAAVLSAAVLVAGVAAGPAAGQAPGPAAAARPAGASPIGLWIDHTGRGAVEIAACGSNLCGRIVWLKEPNDKSGKPLLDQRNGDARQRAKPICGLQIIGGLVRQSDGSWDDGWIYDPEQGESFDVELRLLAGEMLQVKGYKGLKLFNKTFQWRRAAETPGPRCAA